MANPTKLVYGKTPHIIKTDIYKNYGYFIIKNVVGPCVYVVLKNKPKWDIFELNEPHGGITYCDFGLIFYAEREPAKSLVDFDKYVIGWDFMHSDDFLPNIITITPKYNSLFDGTVWSLNRIEQNVFDTIDEIVNKN